MRLAVASCWAYRDTWTPFFALLDKFWPNHPAPFLITDRIDDPAYIPAHIWNAKGDWCARLADFAQHKSDEPILMLQDDFFLSGPVQTDLVKHALGEMKRLNAGCVRLYPCPGGNIFYDDSFVGSIPRGTPYRISCQASIWNPAYLSYIAEVKGTASNFEIQGSIHSNKLPSAVLAWKRDAKPWPIEYLCTAIVRGKWLPDAKTLCEQHGIEANWSMREFQAA
jgi:hypothetical protein